MLLAASAAWAISIVAVRGHRFDASPLTLAPWQMLVAAALLCLWRFVEGRLHGIGARGSHRSRTSGRWRRPSLLGRRRSGTRGEHDLMALLATPVSDC
jgi:hypothetical protein